MRKPKDVDTQAELQEMLDSVGWDAACTSIRRTAGVIRSKILSHSVAPDQLSSYVNTLGLLKTILLDIYQEAGVDMPDKLKAVFE